MSSNNPAALASKKMLWAGYVVSTLPVAMLVMSGVMKVMQPPDVVKGFASLGWPVNLAIAWRSSSSVARCST